jgi:hypothetical protein
MPTKIMRVDIAGRTQKKKASERAMLWNQPFTHFSRL